MLGIDAGASHTRIRLEDRPGAAVVERAGAGLNGDDVTPEILDQDLRALLDGCPRPGVVVAGVAGHAGVRTAVGAWLEHWSGARVTTVPDYVLALRSFAPPVGIVVSAGTGSVVVSHDHAGRVVKTGGLGYRLGDEGSAFRLGQALVARYLEGVPEATRLGGAIEHALGAARADVVRTVHESRQPAAVLGRVAPVLTTAADAGDEWAQNLVAREMAPLAELTARHVERFRGPSATDAITIGLAGGVWRSVSARDAFGAAVAALLDSVRLVPADHPPVVGALRLAWLAGNVT